MTQTVMRSHFSEHCHLYLLTSQSRLENYSQGEMHKPWWRAGPPEWGNGNTYWGMGYQAYDKYIGPCRFLHKRVVFEEKYLFCLLSYVYKNRKKSEKDHRTIGWSDTCLQSQHLGDGLGPSASITNQETFTYRPIRWSHFPIWASLFMDDSSFVSSWQKTPRFLCRLGPWIPGVWEKVPCTQAGLLLRPSENKEMWHMPQFTICPREDTSSYKAHRTEFDS